jgi:hypothetical protein
VTIEKLKKYKSPVLINSQQKLLKQKKVKISSEIQKNINSIWHKEELPQIWKVLFDIPI